MIRDIHRSCPRSRRRALRRGAAAASLAITRGARAIPIGVGEGDINWAPIPHAAQDPLKYDVVERDGAPATRDFAEDRSGFLTCYSY